MRGSGWAPHYQRSQGDSDSDPSTGLPNSGNQPQYYLQGQRNDQLQQPIPPSQIWNAQTSRQSFSSSLVSSSSSGGGNYLSKSPSGSSSELADQRGFSCLTPTSSRETDRDGYVVEEQQSPANAERTLQGIGGTDYNLGCHYAQGDYLPDALDASLPLETHFTQYQTPETFQWSCSQWISTPIPARENRPGEPWSQLTLYYEGQSYLPDVVEEGPEFHNTIHTLQETNVDWQGPPDPRRGTGQHGHAHTPCLHNGLSRHHPHQELESVSNGTPRFSASASSSPAGSTLTMAKRHGIRKGPLSEIGKRNAKLMRTLRSCIRCFFMKEKCVLDEQSAADGVCVKCRKLLNSYRTWDLGCSRLGLDQRTRFMVPRALVLQLSAVQVRSFIKKHAWRATPNSSIKLSLTLGFGEPLRVNAVEVFPRGERTNRMLGFGLSGSGLTTKTMMDSPPVLPLLADRRAIEQHINQWLDVLIREHGSELPEYCFWELHEELPKDMLTTILTYYQNSLPQLESTGSGPFQTLRWALKLTVLNHIMSHPFAVPIDEIGALNDQMQHYKVGETEEWVCPRLANRVMKHIVLPMLNLTIGRVLSDLQKMLRSRGEEEKSWDQAFCIVFLCLTVVARTQESLVERAVAAEEEGDDSFTSWEAVAGVKEMEAELSTHLIGMFHHRFGTNRKETGKGKSYNPLASNAHDGSGVTSHLAEMIRSTIDCYGTDMFEEVDLDHMAPNRMKEKNVMRLLSKFLMPFFQHETPAHM